MPFDPSLNPFLVGVIDLMGGRAVHAVQGQRQDYQPVGFCDGCPKRLVAYYRDQGIRQFYVADLTAIECGRIDHPAILDLIRSVDLQTDAMSSPSWFLDLGWRGEESAADFEAMDGSMEVDVPVGWVAATETMQSLDSLQRLADIVDPESIVLSLDHVDGRLQGPCHDLAQWLTKAQHVRVGAFLILDLAAVGSGSGPRTASQCRAIREAQSSAKLYTGGGIRSSDDVKLLRAAGCDRILVATSLYPDVA